jgi:hypothetical protein
MVGEWFIVILASLMKEHLVSNGIPATFSFSA